MKVKIGLRFRKSRSADYGKDTKDRTRVGNITKISERKAGLFVLFNM